jgi:hypothetical protein
MKEEIKAKTQLLQATCTVALQQGLPLLHRDLEDELAKALQEEIDWEVMTDMLINSSNWTPVKLKDPLPAGEFEEWKSVLKGAHRVHYSGTIWLFELEEDAQWFALKWSN